MNFLALLTTDVISILVIGMFRQIQLLLPIHWKHFFVVAMEHVQPSGPKIVIPAQLIVPVIEVSLATWDCVKKWRQALRRRYQHGRQIIPLECLPLVDLPV